MAAVPSHPYSPADVREMMLARLTGQVWCDYGSGVDVDSAWDSAVDACSAGLGSMHIPSIASRDTSTLHLLDVSASSWALASIAVLQATKAGESGLTFAAPVIADGAYQRRKLSVKTTDVSLPWSEGLVVADPDSVRILDGILAEQGLTIETREQVESIVVSSSKIRVKPTVVKSEGGRKPGAVLVGSDGRVLQWCDSVSLARKAAVEAVKQGRISASDSVVILNAAGRAGVADLTCAWDGVDRVLPAAMLRIDAQVVSRRTSLKVTLASRKETAKEPKIIGWVFAGRL